MGMNGALVGPSSHFELSGVFELSDLGVCEVYCIGLIHKYIIDEICKVLVQDLIISRLDYGNALLYNISLSLTNRHQRVQNCAITPVLIQLH